MACLKRPIVASLMGRSYATQAAQKLVNPGEANLARMSIIYNAGSKYETPANTGITHAARMAISAGNPDAITSIELPRLVSQLGGSLTCDSTREHMIFTYEGQHESINYAAAALFSVARPANYRDPTELEFLLPQINLELSRLEHAPQVQAAELAHKAAFGRGGMANSLYMPRFAVGSHSMEMINEFMLNFYSPANATVVTSGLSESASNNLMEYYKQQCTNEGAKQSLASKYQGGEAYQDALGNNGTFALAFEGSSLGGANSAALGVLRHLIGQSEPSCKYGDGKSCCLISKNSSVDVDSLCFNYSYSDCGLFGVAVTADGNDLGKAVDSTVATLSKLKDGSGITEQDLNRAKVKFAMENASSYEDEHGVCVSRMQGNAVSTLAAEAKAVQGLTLAQVKDVAKKLFSSPASLAAVGNLKNMPYLKNIKL